MAAAGILAAGLLLSWFILRRLSRPDLIFAAAAKSAGSARRLSQDCQRGLANDLAYANLFQLYAPLVDEVNGSLTASNAQNLLWFVTDDQDRPYLAVVVPNDTGTDLADLIRSTVIDVDAAWTDRVSGFAEPRQVYVASLRGNTGHQVPHGIDDEGGDNLILNHLDLTGSPRVDASLGTYGQIVRTSDSLINEFALYAFLARDRTGQLSWFGKLTSGWWPAGRAIELTPRQLLKALPWRAAIHGWANNAYDLLLRPRSRASGIGVAVTMLANGTPKPAAFVARRSAAVGTYPGVRHVLPSGMCNARVDSVAMKYQVRQDFLYWTMLGELLEECYDVREMADYGSEDWIGYIKKHLGIRKLAAAPRMTGLAIDLLNLRLEVCARIPVAPTSGDGPQFNVCWEYSRSVGVTLHELASQQSPRTDFVQSGAAALALTERHCLAHPD